MSEHNPVAEYSKELAEKFAPLTEQETHQLIIEMHQGSEDAKIRLVESHLAMVVSIAKRFAGCGVPELDLIQEGSLALMKAAESYSTGCGRSFAYYAGSAVRKAMVNTIADCRTGSPLSIKQVENAVKVMGVYHRLEQELNRTPTLEDIAPHVEFSAEELGQILKLIEDGATDEIPLEEAICIADDTSVSYLDELRQQLPALLQTVTPRERKVLELRFGLMDGRSRSLEEVAELLGVPRERVRQMEQKALRRLRPRPSRSKKLKDFLS